MANRINIDFRTNLSAERTYITQLLSISQEIRRIVRNDKDPVSALRRYARQIEDWAFTTSNNMIDRVNKHNLKQWAQLRNSWGIRLNVVEQIPNYYNLIMENVLYIQSLPLECAENISDLIVNAINTGQRTDDLAKLIQHEADITIGRAKLIARTETSRSQTIMTEQRAKIAGSDGYIWRTSEDQKVRQSHKMMDNRYVNWATPPTLDGLVGHAGALPNCRCYPEPVFN